MSRKLTKADLLNALNAAGVTVPSTATLPQLRNLYVEAGIDERINSDDDADESVNETVNLDEQLAKLEKKRKILALQKEVQELENDLAVGVQKLSITDVDNIVPKFSGDNAYSIEKWIIDFENVMQMCKGSAHFKYMSARRLLTGTAAIFLRSSSAQNYAELKNQLLLQFKRQVTSYDVHNELRKRRRLPNENIISYMLCMKEIAAQANLDDSEVINAIIEGLSDRSAHTSILYTAKNFDDLQHLLLIYDKRRPVVNTAERREIPMREPRCFNCSKSGHISSQCSQPKRVQGSCFICSSRDHQIKNCPKKMSGVTVHAIDDQEDYVYPIEHNQKIIVPSSIKKFMSDKIPYVFRQNSDFYYLSGCLEQDSILMMTINEKSNVKTSLFMRKKDKNAELWDGPRTGIENAPKLFGVDEAFDVQYFESILKQRLQNEKYTVWFDAVQSEQKNLNEMIGLNKSPTQFIHSMRLIKSAAEQNLMRRTCQIASKAINETMFEARPGISEHQIFAMIDFKCRWQHASYMAYPPVVASGTNATIIHYINNNQLTRSGQLVLLDAGCEYGGYTSDITRTWPIDGTFTSAQRVLYDIVLTVQKELILSILEEGIGDTLDNLFETMCIKLGKYLLEAGIIVKDMSTPVDYARAGYEFCPHHVSHYLGMDVHDTPLIPRNLQLCSGMVFTVEPGIYIDSNRLDVPKEFRGLGVRIEDDVLITKDNTVEILSSTCIKERSELEKLCKR